MTRRETAAKLTFLAEHKDQVVVVVKYIGNSHGWEPALRGVLRTVDRRGVGVQQPGDEEERFVPLSSIRAIEDVHGHTLASWGSA